MGGSPVLARLRAAPTLVLAPAGGGPGGLRQDGGIDGLQRYEAAAGRYDAMIYPRRGRPRPLRRDALPPLRAQRARPAPPPPRPGAQLARGRPACAPTRRPTPRL